MIKVGQPKRITSLERLHWYVREKVEQLLINANARVNNTNEEFRVFESIRSLELQAWYYAQGRTRDEDEPIITNSKTPIFHHPDIGLAVDIVPYINGQPRWDRPDLFKILGEEAVKLGFTWGGNWKFYDAPHVQMDDGLESSDIRKGLRPSWFYDDPPGEPSDWAADSWIKACEKIGKDGRTIFDGTVPKGQFTREMAAKVFDRLGLLD